MADDSMLRTTASGNGTVSVRQRPSLLLMKIRVRAVEATLELGLARLKRQCEAATQWLKRAGAVRVETGDPHFDDQIGLDPITKMQAAVAARVRLPAGGSSQPRERGVNQVITALWDIAAMSAEEILVFLDRLRFEAGVDADSAEGAEEPPPWETPEAQLREILTQIHRPPTNDREPVFLFIARLSEEQQAKATVEAVAQARQNAERLARGAGMRLGTMKSLHFGGFGSAPHRTDKMMDRQRCMALLAGSCYDLAENELISDDPRPAEFTITVNASFALE